MGINPQFSRLYVDIFVFFSHGGIIDTFFSICLFQSSTEPVLALEFHPSEKHSIVSCGKGHITFWSFEGGTLSKKQGIYDVSQKFACIYIYIIFKIYMS